MRSRLYGNAKRRMLVLLVGSLAISRAGFGADLEDMFANRQVVSGDSGTIPGNNAMATVELNEPRHAGKTGGHSVWITWTAPADGIVTFDTVGSSFDTLLAVYFLQPGTNSPMLRLKPIVANDDDGTNKTSLVQFGVTAGTNYEIAVDGFNGGTGDIALNWSLLRSSGPPPIILSVPRDRSLQAGDTVTLSVDYQASKSVKLQWFLNDNDVVGANSATLVVSNFQAVNVGLYTLRISVSDGSGGNIRFFTQPIEIQINSEGLTNVLARDKLFDAEDSGLKGSDGNDGGLFSIPNNLPSQGAAAPQAPGVIGFPTPGLISSRLPLPQPNGIHPLGLTVGVVRGYNGTQIFNTTFATTDPNEPQHCGLVGGASYWFAYQPPTNGTASLDTEGSTFDTVLAVYTFVPPLLGYSGLIPVNCDNNSGLNGLTSRLQFSAASGSNYLVVVDGVNGARGIAYLNYALTSAPPPDKTPATVARDPQPRSVAVGSSVVFDVLANGAAPFNFLWFKNTTPLANETASTLTLTNLQTNDAAGYSVRVSNSWGGMTSAVAALSVIVPPLIITQPLPQNVLVGSGAVFTVSASGTGPLHYLWAKDGAPITNVDSPNLSLPTVLPTDAGTYEVQVVNAAGSAVSTDTPLAFLGRSTASIDPVSKFFTLAFPAAGPASFAIEFTDTLDPASWQPWNGLLATNNGIVSTSTGPATNQLRFFRVHFQ